MSGIGRSLKAKLAIITVIGATVGLVSAGLASAVPPQRHDTDVATLQDERPTDQPADLDQPASADLDQPASADLDQPASADPDQPASADLDQPASADESSPAPQNPPTHRCSGKKIDSLPMTFKNGKSAGETKIFREEHGQICAQTVKSEKLAKRPTTTEVYVQRCEQTAADTGCTVQPDQVFSYSENQAHKSAPVRMPAAGRCVQVVGKIYSSHDRGGDVAIATSEPICHVR